MTITNQDQAVDFEPHRRAVTGLAYRMLRLVPRPRTWISKTFGIKR
jgi:hypothetical protein